MLRRLGGTEPELVGLERGDLGLFAPGERAALEFAVELTLRSKHITEAAFTNLRRHFDEGQIVEIAAVAGLFNYFNRFNNALEVEPTH